ncbi:acetate--CoA ligase family protein [Pseudonocardia nigra]|uniref:acetate--CoA ligase family protein n=1 Tax=Pseudonocardia nigra TaxID=1921578 RepID=UPI001C5D5BF9|nr:acetate--CoA ligase family protein [Pseudonocardia nigra]
MTRSDALRALFDPGSVAIVGASDDERKYGNWIAVQALTMDRPVHLVNRRGTPVLGRPTYRSLAELPAPAELVVVAVPAGGFEETVTDALAAGTRAIVGISAGFAELGPEGRARQAALVERVRAAGAVLLGPNCLGVFDSTSGLRLASNPLPAGDVALISQSGNLALELSALLEPSGLGFSRFASLGNQADLSLAELVRACVAHDGTRVIAVYAEDFGDGRGFARAAAEATAAGKPVVVLTVGAGQAAARSASSHTGALTSAMSAVDAACVAAGVERVATPREMAHLIAGLRPMRSPRGRAVAVLADGGGHASIAGEVAEAAGLAVPEFSPSLADAVKAELTPSAGTANPVDLAGAGEQDITSFSRVLRLLVKEPAVDQVLMTGYFGGYGEYGPEMAEREIEVAADITRLAQEAGMPVVAHTMRPDSRAARVLRAGGVPTFAAVEDAAGVLARLARRAERPPPYVPDIPPARHRVDGDGYWETRDLLTAAGVPFPAARRVATRKEALAAAAEIGRPVVLKALGLLHKSDAGGVALGLRDPAGLAAAFDAMHARLDAPGYVVETMARLDHGVELIAGVTRDPRFGPVAMVGLGGVFTEVLRDVAFGLAPLRPADAERLLRGLRGAPLLTGARGRTPVDLAAVARVVAAVSEVAAAHPEIAELEVNPVLALPDGALALDARCVLAPPNHDTH